MKSYSVLLALILPLAGCAGAMDTVSNAVMLHPGATPAAVRTAFDLTSDI